MLDLKNLSPEQLQGLSPEQKALLGDTIANTSPRTHGTVVVHSTATIGMFGGRCYDHSLNKGRGRPYIEIQPYTRTAAGARVAPLFIDTNGEIYILMAANVYKNLNVPGGFMNPKACEAKAIPTSPRNVSDKAERLLAS